jgi:hypothetical protein
MHNNVVLVRQSLERIVLEAVSPHDGFGRFVNAKMSAIFEKFYISYFEIQAMPKEIPQPLGKHGIREQATACRSGVMVNAVVPCHRNLILPPFPFDGEEPLTVHLAFDFRSCFREKQRTQRSQNILLIP